MKRRIECVHAADGLKELIINRPELPILVVAGPDVNPFPDAIPCGTVQAELGEFLDADPPEYLVEPGKTPPVYLSRAQFRADLEAYWKEEQYIFNLAGQIAEDYDRYWTNCILLRVDR